MKCATSVFIISGLLPSLVACEAKDGVEPGGPAQVVAPIIGGTEASPGEFPWQLSQQRLVGTIWSHSCGAVLLSANYAVTAAHCVDGVPPSSMRIVAGLHARSDESGAQIVGVSSYKMHESYNVGASTFANDIAIITFATPIVMGGNVQAAVLPANNNNNYAGLTVVMSGWGRTSASNVLPDTLQKASIQVISTAQCNSYFAPIAGASVTDNQICVYDSSNTRGACSGDGGGPLNAPDGSTRVAGITSWGISSGGACQQTYPTVYTRTSAYLGWIAANTP